MGMMQRLRARVLLQPFFSRTVSARRLIILLAPLGSLAQRGTSPQRSARSWRAPSGEAVTTRMSLAGATFQLGGWASNPSGSARNCSSRNWSWLVELNRPHLGPPYPTTRTARRVPPRSVEVRQHPLGDLGGELDGMAVGHDLELGHAQGGVLSGRGQEPVDVGQDRADGQHGLLDAIVVAALGLAVGAQDLELVRDLGRAAPE